MSKELDLLRRYNIWDGGKPDTGLDRRRYTGMLSALTDNRLVKVLTGQRRTGKSYVLRQMAMKLLEQGVPRRNIFMLNRELEDFSFVETHKSLDALVREYEAELKPEGKVYIFIDEVQNIDGWEHFVNSYSQDYMRSYELFISGSNSKMLSGQLATLLSGRYVNIEVCPFSYGEYLEFYGKERGKATYAEYLHSSGLPELYRLDGDDARRYYVSALKDTILLRDIIGRYGVRDVQLLEDLFAYVVNNASNMMSVGNVVKYLKGRGRKVSYDTAAAYLRYMEDAHLIHPVYKYNIKGRAVINGAVKYYANDLAYRNYLYRGFGYGEGYLLENAVYMELRRQGFDIYVGNINDKEVDFVAMKGDRTVYVQAAYQITDATTARREYASLEAINDSFEKYIVTMDDFTNPMNNGIRHVNAWTFDENLARHGA